MKIVPTIAGVLLAGSFATSANAGPSQGEVMTLCKNQIKSTFEDVTRIRTFGIKERAKGTFINFRVSTEGAETQVVKCSYVDGIASLTDREGVMVAAKADGVNTGS
ncbi:MAG: hypothetical protein JJ921_14960 [Pseudomonadales bacterium]|nr:hypothetical protein [Pseudomonadales bacterium]MBO7004305.1 hypothetical protein [Pseudomonadales bacterium]